MSIKTGAGAPRLYAALTVAALVLAGGVFSAVRADNGPSWLKEYAIPGLAPEKQAALDKERADRITAMQTVPQVDKKSMTPPAPGHPNVKTQIGPFKGPGPFPGGMYDMNNAGSFAVNDVQFGVYAGALKGTAQGVIIVSFRDFRTGKSGEDFFMSPAADGSLTITSIDGSSVGFAASSGAVGHFDVISHLFSQ